MKLLSRAEILSATDKRTMTVATPEWGADTSVLIGVMGPLEYARLVDYSDSLGTPVTTEPADDEEPNVPDDFCCDSPAADIPGDIDTIDADQSPPILPTAADERDKEEAEPTRTYTRADLDRKSVV